MLDRGLDSNWFFFSYGVYVCECNIWINRRYIIKKWEIKRKNGGRLSIEFRGSCRYCLFLSRVVDEDIFVMLGLLLKVLDGKLVWVEIYLIFFRYIVFVWEIVNVVKFVFI